MPFPPDAPHVPVGKSVPVSLPFRGVTFLLVEDSRFSCDALRLICLRAGGRLRRAETLAQARAHLACYRPDVAIVDLGLPDGRGEGLIADLAARGIPVLGTSGDPEGRALALTAGAAGFLDKPLSGIAAFQALILGLLAAEDRAAPGLHSAPSRPDTQPDTQPDSPALQPSETALPIDPLAFRDDLARAAPLITGPDRGYAADFLRSLGRAAGDGALEAAANGAATAPGRAALARLVAERLSAVDPVA